MQPHKKMEVCTSIIFQVNLLITCTDSKTLKLGVWVRFVPPSWGPKLSAWEKLSLYPTGLIKAATGILNASKTKVDCCQLKIAPIEKGLLLVYAIKTLRTFKQTFQLLWNCIGQGSARIIPNIPSQLTM